MEPSGDFTLVEAKEPRPGLSLIPPWDGEYRAQQPKAPETQVCSNCGNTQVQPNTACTICGANAWEFGVIT